MHPTPQQQPGHGHRPGPGPSSTAPFNCSHNTVVMQTLHMPLEPSVMVVRSATGDQLTQQPHNASATETYSGCRIPT